ncbi:MAG TPA: trans-aconitate 2-methyltransferase [Propionibacteriaceae bacterium]|nr:trans-aconitate 2-methyltransferase [Propionibacteriaceae bacterium]
MWDPATYLQFADERARPFADLIGQVHADEPANVVDLGCGPGQLTASLADRWPGAAVLGIDSSPEMIEQARRYAGDRVSFAVQDLREWRPAEQVDVIISNATLQWVPGHRELLPRLVAALAPGGWLAFQVPGNFTEPSHMLLHRLADDPRFAEFTAKRDRPAAYDAVTYANDLHQLGCHVNAWETTYLHVLTGPDPVFRWIASTGARPVLQALPVEAREVFVAEYKAALGQAYPAHPYGTLLPFRRVFVVAQRTVS